jgi:hypothetical protein
MKALCTTLLLAGSLIGAACLAAPNTGQGTTQTSAQKAQVIIGSTSCFYIRECAAGQTPQQRADHITDVFNKYLGGSAATFSLKSVGKNSVISMNKDQLLLVTPQDAKSAKQKTPAQLAALWKTSLTKAFDETKATK